MSINPLNVAISGLRVAQAQIGVASHNIANATTDGYSRKVLNQYSTVIAGEGNGVRAGVVMRRIDEILVRDYRSQVSSTSNLEIKQRYMNSMQEMFGPPDGEYSISSTIGKIQNAFSQLANQPEDAYLLTNAFNRSSQMVEQFHQYAQTIIQMRNNTQDEMSQSIKRVNQLTERIAELNRTIKSAYAVGRPVGDLEDHRDLAIRELSAEIDISYFRDETNALIVMTKNGQLLADTQPIKLYFNPNPQGAQTYYPASAAAIMLGDPVVGTDVTSERILGGRLGALVGLRDETLPTYLAQLDELAHKMATRFAAQGLELFTMPDGSVPPDNPVDYAGFSLNMVINPAVQIDHSLLRKGTDIGAQVNNGSAEILRKVVEFAFGNTAYQEITGDVDISDNSDTLFNLLGLQAQAKIIGSVRLNDIASLDTLGPINPGTADSFQIQIGANPPVTITIGAGDDLNALIATINTAIPATPPVASVGAGGQLVLTANETIEILPDTMNFAGIGALGLQIGTTPAKNPSFEIALGLNNMTAIEILPTDTSDDLLAKLNAIPGMQASLTVDGYLQIRPEWGGDMAFIDGFNNPLKAMNVRQASIPHTPFRVTGLGPGGNLNGLIQTGTTLHDYATQIIGMQSQQASDVDSALTAEQSYMNTIQKNFLDRTGVNIDEEMAALITIQMAYTASARAISAVEAMMDELMNTFR